MSPSQFHDEQALRRENNGQRPSPLKISKDSHLILKTSSSSCSASSSTSSLTIAAAATKQHHQNQPQQRHPVIIYTHSPKVIHTQARDFMALVQKLTGLSRSEDSPPQAPPAEEVSNSPGEKAPEDAASSSVLTEENCGIGEAHPSSSSVSPVFEPQNPFFSDMPLFTPSSSEFFCSPRPFYRYPDSVFSSPTMGSSISPSMMEVFKGFREY